MMFPSAVNGQMPFVDKYKQEQLKKVIEKHRSRHHSGPDSRSNTDKSAKHRNTHSMPILWQSVYAGQRPRFISMPTLEDTRYSSHSCGSAGPHVSGSSRHSIQQRSPEVHKSHKQSFLSSLKKLFSNKREDESSSTRNSSGATVQRHSSRAHNSRSKNKKLADSDVVATGGRSPKRQRIRTISNLSGVMETIEEVNEVMASTDHLSDSSDSCSNSSSELTYRSVTSITSAPELSTPNLLYSCSNLSNFSSSSSSSHHGSSSDFICVA